MGVSAWLGSEDKAPTPAPGTLSPFPSGCAGQQRTILVGQTEAELEEPQVGRRGHLDWPAAQASRSSRQAPACVRVPPSPGPAALLQGWLAVLRQSQRPPRDSGRMGARQACPPGAEGQLRAASRPRGPAVARHRWSLFQVQV